jgi:hypothetical protein
MPNCLFSALKILRVCPDRIAILYSNQPAGWYHLILLTPLMVNQRKFLPPSRVSLRSSRPSFEVKLM